MTTRRCSCCSQPGHNITRCDDTYARTITNEIKNSHLELAIQLVNDIPNNIVKFVLVNGFNASVSLNREALRGLVQQYYTNTIRPSPLIAVRERLESQRLQQQQQRAERRQEAEEERQHEEHRRQRALLRSRRNNEDGYAHFALLVEQFQLLHVNVARRTMFKSLAGCYLAILERMANTMYRYRNPTPDEFNLYIMNKLTGHGLECPVDCLCYSPLFARMRDVVWQNFSMDEICHITNLARMYNYQRLIHNQMTFAIIFPPQDDTTTTTTNQMKPLPIKIVLCSPCETDDSCGVCFDELKPANIVKTGCGHVYCSTCIAGVAHQRGLKSFITCPGCRAEITELKVPNEDEEKLVADGLKPLSV